MLARLGVVVFVAMVAVATVLEWSREEEAPIAMVDRASEPARDPLRDEQRRCQQLGEAAVNEPACLKVWSETRDRFLGRTTAPIEGR